MTTVPEYPRVSDRLQCRECRRFLLVESADEDRRLDVARATAQVPHIEICERCHEYREEELMAEHEDIGHPEPIPDCHGCDLAAFAAIDQRRHRADGGAGA